MSLSRLVQRMFLATTAATALAASGCAYDAPSNKPPLKWVTYDEAHRGEVDYPRFFRAAGTLASAGGALGGVGDLATAGKVMSGTGRMFDKPSQPKQKKNEKILSVTSYCTFACNEWRDEVPSNGIISGPEEIIGWNENSAFRTTDPITFGTSVSRIVPLASDYPQYILQDREGKTYAQGPAPLIQIENPLAKVVDPITKIALTKPITPNTLAPGEYTATFYSAPNIKIGSRKITVAP